MHTFDMTLLKLYKPGKISLEEALKNANSKNNLRLRITLDERPSKHKEQTATPVVKKKLFVEDEKPTPTAVKPSDGLSGLSLTPMDEGEES